MILRQFKIKEAHDEPTTVCFYCLLQSNYDLGFNYDPKKMAEKYIANYVRDGEGTINCYHCGPVRYERFRTGWVEVRPNAVSLQ